MFLTLTCLRGDSIYVRADRIHAIEPDGDGPGSVVWVECDSFVVTESPETILSLLGGAGDEAVTDEMVRAFADVWLDDPGREMDESWRNDTRAALEAALRARPRP